MSLTQAKASVRGVSIARENDAGIARKVARLKPMAVVKG